MPVDSPRLASLLQLLPLDALPRTGWLQHGIARPESVAGHLIGTAHLALALGPAIAPPLELGRVLSMATVHDAPEAWTGDLPRSGARLLPEGAKHTMELRAAEGLLGPLSATALDAYREYEARETREARFVGLCDQLQMGVRLLAYLRGGQRGLDDFRSSVAGLDCREFPPVASFQEQLLAAMPE